MKYLKLTFFLFLGVGLLISLTGCDFSSPQERCSSCTGGKYNCSDFDIQYEAQQCYDYCKDQGYEDIYNLDGDDCG